MCKWDMLIFPCMGCRAGEARWSSYVAAASGGTPAIWMNDKICNFHACVRLSRQRVGEMVPSSGALTVLHRHLKKAKNQKNSDSVTIS